MYSDKIVGKRIKSIRESKSITVEQLAERSGLDVEQISRLEEEKDLPSLTPLIKIARALGTRLGTFLDDQDSLGPVVSRRDNYRSAVSFSTTQASSHTHMDYYSLAPDKTGRHIEPFLIHVASQQAGADNFQLSSHEGEEFIYCLEGTLEITYGSTNYQLSEGDSIFYDSIVAHHVHAAGDEGAKILAVVYTPL
ncbi:MAG: XRE family transcriptional regulator [Dysgonamonadaceae bacterium]|jgi:transcriptional regulator with XRE-family HTH domain|nr:XRE family transcriptional regulator [Dysgonamonadaceae bacterium]